MTAHPNATPAYRDQIVVLVYGHLVAGSHRLRKRYRASFGDPDLGVEDLSHYGAVKAILCFDWLVAKDAEKYLSLPAIELQKVLVGHAMRCMAWRIIDIYRRRDHQRSAIAPEELLAYLDSSFADRVDLWRRIEPLMGRMSTRQRAVVRGLWEGASTDTISADLKVSTNVVQKDLAAIRSLAA